MVAFLRKGICDPDVGRGTRELFSPRCTEGGGRKGPQAEKSRPSDVWLLEGNPRRLEKCCVKRKKEEFVRERAGRVPSSGGRGKGGGERRSSRKENRAEISSASIQASRHKKRKERTLRWLREGRRDRPAHEKRGGSNCLPRFTKKKAR